MGEIPPNLFKQILPYTKQTLNKEELLYGIASLSATWHFKIITGITRLSLPRTKAQIDQKKATFPK